MLIEEHHIKKSMFKGIMSKRKSGLPAKNEGGNKVDKLTILIDMDDTIVDLMSVWI